MNNEQIMDEQWTMNGRIIAAVQWSGRVPKWSGNVWNHMATYDNLLQQNWNSWQGRLLLQLPLHHRSWDLLPYCHPHLSQSLSFSRVSQYQNIFLPAPFPNISTFHLSHHCHPITVHSCPSSEFNLQRRGVFLSQLRHPFLCDKCTPPVEEGPDLQKSAVRHFFTN